MKQNNVTFSIGNIALIDKVNEKFGLFDHVFNNLGGKAKNIKSSAKLFSYNRLGDCVSINQLTTPSLKSCFVFEICAYSVHCFSNGLKIAVL